LAESLGRPLAPIRTVLLNDYGIDTLYGAVVVGSARGVGRFVSSVFDRQVVDGIVNGVPTLVRMTGDGIAQLESGYVRTYALAILFGSILIILSLIIGGR